MYGVSTILVIVLIAYLYIFHFGGIEKIVNDKLSSVIDDNYLLDIQVGQIKGSYFSGFVLENIDVYYNDPNYRYELLKIPRLSTSYSFSNLWDKKYLFDFLTIDSAIVTLVKDSSKNWVIPDFRSKKKDEEETGKIATLPSFSIGALNIQNMTVRLLDNKDTITFNNIFLSLEFKGEENTYAFDIEKFVFSSNQENVDLNAAGGKITFADNRFIFNDVALVVDSTRVKLAGNILLGKQPSGEISFAADDIVIDNIVKYIGPKNLKGEMDLNGSVSFVGPSLEGSINVGGELAFMDFQNLFIDFRYNDKQLYLDTLYGTVFKDCAIDGKGEVNFNKPETYNLDAEIRQFNLNNLVQNSFTSNLSGHVTMQGESFNHKDLRLLFNTDLYESYFDDYPLQTASGKFVVTSDSIMFLDSFKVEYFENVFYATGNVDYKNNMHLDVTAELNNLDRYKGKLFIDQPGGRAYSEAVIDGKTSDPDLHGFLASDSMWIYGLFADSLYSLFDIDRFLTGRQGMVEVDLFEGTAYAVPYETGYTYLTIDSNIVKIDTAAMINQFTRLASKGYFDYGAVPNTLVLDSFYLNLANQSFYNRDDIVIDIDSSGFNFSQSAIGNRDQWLAVNGRVNYDESMDMLLSINHIPIEPWKNLYEDSLSVDGLLSCEASLNGTFMEPIIVLKADIDSLSYKDLVLGNLKTVVNYKDLKLNIDSLQVFADPGVYSAYGYLYTDLAFTSDSIERFPDYPMNIRCKAQDKRFDLVSLLMPSVEYINGDFFADIILSGTPQEPHLQGEAYIKKYYDNKEGKTIPAHLKYFDLESPFYTDSAGVTMRDNKIIINKIDTYVYEDVEKRKGRKSHAYVDGVITVKTFENFNYDLDVKIPKPFPFTYELDDISGEVKTNDKSFLHIDGDTPPTVTGNIEIVSMKYLVNFAQENEGSPIMMALSGENSWDLNINIEIESNYRIQNDDIDAEFGGEINLKRTKGTYQFTGELQILRGNGYLFDKTIRLDPGGSVVFEGDDKFNPTLDITGYTYLTAVRDNLETESTTKQLKLGLHITGTLEEPIINVTEDSDFKSNEEIIPLLVANYSGSNTEVSSAWDQRVYGLLSTQVSQIGTKQLRPLASKLKIGLETFEIDPRYKEGGQLDPGKTNVTVGLTTPISPNIITYLTFGENLEGRVEYRILKGLMLQGIRDEKNLYHLNLKINMEFNHL